MLNNDAGVCMHNICFELNNSTVYEINKITSAIFYGRPYRNIYHFLVKKQIKLRALDSKLKEPKPFFIESNESLSYFEQLLFYVY